ncbi:uncharacterized protein DDB_G0290685-like [Rhopilema esculentum]|uniref:uncharacterized protein DDB_G0290685-like n=1 Tax=Rhopilema esculentum TaxID=499914 RepID=UPI0031DE819F
MSTMTVNRLKNGLFGLTLVFALFQGNVSGKSTGIQKKGQQRSYIDIDVTDPFKVPKASEYIDQPIPTYDSYGNKKSEENDHTINYKIGNVKIQSENKAEVEEGQNHGYEEQARPEEEGKEQYGHGFHNYMPEDGPEVPADQEESPHDVEPEPFHSNYDDDEHMHGDSRHNVPKGEWGHEDNGPRNDERPREESGGHLRGDYGPGNGDFRRHEGDEQRFDHGDEERENGDHVREHEEDHEDNWERRGDGEDHEREFGPREEEPRMDSDRENTRDREYYEKDDAKN